MCVYEGLATVTVLALYEGQEPAERTSLEFPLRLVNVGSGRVRVELQHYLQGPKEANALRVMLPHGTMVQGLIVDGSNEPTGGWLLIDVEQYELALEQPGTLNGWQWQ
ncbi:hypothetical protein [Pseudomonas sp. Sample_9]|jgi:hypothetical protein|uniref:hypothetical protein n=1 Tax=Pseudomonas sp. Sample_9 TaxID=2382158 RepID=UPI001032E24A|nr:hypothetical protein [Pseudomonas sp. Sample_9]